MGEVVQISVAREASQRRTKGTCKHCLWHVGPLQDSCDHPRVGAQMQAVMIKTEIARKLNSLCGSTGTLWEAKP